MTDPLFNSKDPNRAAAFRLSHSEPRVGTRAETRSVSVESRPGRWTIDDHLEDLEGQSVRVAAEAFTLGIGNRTSPHLIWTKDLILPDNTPTDGLPVYFEGVLLEHMRQIGVVHVCLGPPVNPGHSAEGCVPFRGRVAVILRGPALVRLAIPFQVERVPAVERNYWQDLRLPQAQLVLNFAEGD